MEDQPNCLSFFHLPSIVYTINSWL